MRTKGRKPVKPKYTKADRRRSAARAPRNPHHTVLQSTPGPSYHAHIAVISPSGRTRTVASPSASHPPELAYLSAARSLMAERIQACGIELVWKRVQDVVAECGEAMYVGQQVELLTVALRRLLDGREPHLQQVRALRRLVYGHGDTLLIARTGFGKSIVFQAYSILTGRITIQIIPLSKLGDEQLATVKGLPYANPCLVTADTRHTDKQLLRDIAGCKYTHVLLGPEQATSPEFRRILLSSEFQSRIGLVAIDECHVLSQWEKFRTAYTMILELRRSLPTSVLFFGCSATIDSTAEATIKKHAGFRPESVNLGDLKVIRISVDRPEISLAFLPIPKGHITKFTQVAGCLFASFSIGNAPAPEMIPKTIVFVDGRAKCSSLAAYLRQCLVNFGYVPRLANTVVSIYTSRVADFDQRRLYDEFNQPGSTIRIMVATTALGMGMDLPDVEYVLQWDLPMTKEIADLVQRFGRAARARGRYGRAVLFAPYYLFNSEGREKADVVVVPDSQEPVPAVGARRSRYRHTMASQRQPSGLSQVTFAPAELDSDCESVHSSQSVRPWEVATDVVPEDRRLGEK